jgi:type VI secretion system secreted protein Hcp
MASDMFLKLSGIKGESADDRHRDEIEVLALNWGVSNPGTMAHGGGAGAGKATFSDFQISKRVDRASPTLLKMCATQARIEEGMLAVRKAGRGAQDYMIITMKEVIITSVSLAGTQGDSADLTEAVTLQFAKVELEYKPQKPDGSLDAAIAFKYDIRAHREG